MIQYGRDELVSLRAEAPTICDIKFSFVDFPVKRTKRTWKRPGGKKSGWKNPRNKIQSVVDVFARRHLSHSGRHIGN